MHIVDTAEKVKGIAKEFIGNHLVTKQTGEEGAKCEAVYIVEKISIDKELYLSVTLDRANACPTFIFSPAGGMAIEDVAAETPELIFKIQVPIQDGLNDARLK